MSSLAMRTPVYNGFQSLFTPKTPVEPMTSIAPDRDWFISQAVEAFLRDENFEHMYVRTNKNGLFVYQNRVAKFWDGRLMIATHGSHDPLVFDVLNHLPGVAVEKRGQSLYLNDAYWTGKPVLVEQGSMDWEYRY